MQASLGIGRRINNQKFHGLGSFGLRKPFQDMGLFAGLQCLIDYLHDIGSTKEIQTLMMVVIFVAKLN